MEPNHPRHDDDSLAARCEGHATGLVRGEFTWPGPPADDEPDHVRDAIVALCVLRVTSATEARNILHMWRRGVALSDDDIDYVVRVVLVGDGRPPEGKRFPAG